MTIPYCSIDKGIVETVRLLNEHGFKTTGSCEGGSGHRFPLPTVQIRPVGDIDKARKQLCQFLISQGLKSFTVKTVSMHQKSELAEPYSYVEVEFWR